ARGGKQEVGQAHRREEQRDDPRHGTVRADGFPGSVRRHRKEEQARRQQREVDPRLAPSRHAHDPVGVSVSQQQHELEEHHADRPDDGGSAEPRQDLFREQRLDQEKQERAEENGGGVQRHRPHPSMRVALYSPAMVAGYIRFSLLAEFVAYAVIANWLHWLYGWSYPLLAALCIGAAALGRLVMVLVTATIGHFHHSPREKTHHISP